LERETEVEAKSGCSIGEGDGEWVDIA